MRNKLSCRILMLIGAVWLILPRFFPENEWVYVASPWIYVTCLLYCERQYADKTDWFWFAGVYAVANVIRYFNLLGYNIWYVSILCTLLMCAIFLIPFLGDWFYRKKLDGISSVFVFPILRIGAERGLAIFKLGQQFNLSVSQFGNKLLLQSVSVVGDIFLSFVVALAASAVAYLMLRPKTLKRVLACGGVLILVALIYVWGSFRYREVHSNARTVRMAYATGPQNQYTVDPTEEEPTYEDNVEYLTDTVKEAAEGGAGLLAYAEEAFELYDDQVDAFVDICCAQAIEHKLYMIVTLDVDSTEDGETTYSNEALLISPEGEVLSHYAKSNLIPIIEQLQYTAGDSQIPCTTVTIDGHSFEISYVICYDSTFSDYIRTIDPSTDVLICPSWDWEEVLDLNYRLQATRAVENGVVLFKMTMDGWSIVADPFGNLTYKDNSIGSDYGQVYLVDVPYHSIRTIYQDYGYLSRYLYVAGGIALLVMYILKVRKKSAIPA